MFSKQNVNNVLDTCHNILGCNNHKNHFKYWQIFTFVILRRVYNYSYNQVYAIIQKIKNRIWIMNHIGMGDGGRVRVGKYANHDCWGNSFSIVSRSYISQAWFMSPRPINIRAILREFQMQSDMSDDASVCFGLRLSLCSFNAIRRCSTAALKHTNTK